MKVSIAMATYNGARYLQAQLQSFLDQTRQPDELVVCDDGSSDGTEAIVRKFADSAPFCVKVYRNKRTLGYCANFNRALMNATGDVVFMSDQDDVWFPEKIEYMLRVAGRNPEAQVVMNDAALTDCDLNEVGLTKMGQIRSAGLDMKAFVMGCCCCIRRELLDLVVPIPGGVKSHDTWIVSFADGVGGKIVDNRVLQFYRRHESNESQFIANRTRKVTRIHAFIHAVKSQFGGEGQEKEREMIAQKQLFVEGIKGALTFAPEKFQGPLSDLLVATEAKVGSLQKRLEIRQKWLIPRIVAAMALMVRGGYRHANGVKSVLRDIVG